MIKEEYLQLFFMYAIIWLFSYIVLLLDDLSYFF